MTQERMRKDCGGLDGVNGRLYVCCCSDPSAGLFLYRMSRIKSRATLINPEIQTQSIRSVSLLTTGVIRRLVNPPNKLPICATLMKSFLRSLICHVYHCTTNLRLSVVASYAQNLCLPYSSGHKANHLCPKNFLTTPEKLLCEPAKLLCLTHTPRY